MPHKVVYGFWANFGPQGLKGGPEVTQIRVLVGGTSYPAFKIGSPGGLCTDIQV